MAKKRIIVLSDEATAFMREPAPMPMIEDIYAISDRRAWIVVCTEFQQEKKVLEEMEEANVSAFLPIERRYVRKQTIRETTVAGMLMKRRTKTTRRPADLPLLPGYLFAEVPIRDRGVPDSVAAKIIAADGVSRILGSANGPIPIPAEFVTELQKQQSAGAFDHTTKKPGWARKGVEVRITDGPFASFFAAIEKCMPNDLVRVAVEIFGRQTPVTLELAQLEKRC